MRYSFLILFALMFMGMNALNAQSCCVKASTAAATTSSVEKKSCDMAKATTNTAAVSKCNESATASAQTPSSVAVFVNGLTNLKAAPTKSCDPSACNVTKATANASTKCDPTQCDPTQCDPSKMGTMKASTAKAKTKTAKATASL